MTKHNHGAGRMRERIRKIKERNAAAEDAARQSIQDVIRKYLASGLPPSATKPIVESPAESHTLSLRTYRNGKLTSETGITNESQS